MKTTTLLITLLLCGGILVAQPGPMDRPPRDGVPPMDQLKEYLTLTDAQVQSLKDVQKAWRDAAQPVMEQMAEKSKQLRDAMHQNTVDQATVDSLKAALADLQKKAQSIRDQFQPQALSLLTSQQKTALTALQKALELMPAAQQAAFFNLLDSPQGVPGGFGLNSFGPEGRRGPGMMGGRMQPRNY
jgi:Spy/CpxP family protein refolding chaperone